MPNVETQSPQPGNGGPIASKMPQVTFADYNSPYPPPSPSGIRPSVGQIWPRGNTRGNT